MKYSFNKIDEDTTELVYKNKKFTIKRDIELLKEIDSINFDANTQIMLDLKKKGLTVNDLIVTKKVGNKTFEDRSNIIELEEKYTEQMKLKLYQNFAKRNFDMSLEELAMDIGLNDEDAFQFGMDFASALKGNDNTPSNSKEEKE